MQLRNGLSFYWLLQPRPKESGRPASFTSFTAMLSVCGPNLQNLHVEDACASVILHSADLPPRIGTQGPGRFISAARISPSGTFKNKHDSHRGTEVCRQGLGQRLPRRKIRQQALTPVPTYVCLYASVSCGACHAFAGLSQLRARYRHGKLVEDCIEIRHLLKATNADQHTVRSCNLLTERIEGNRHDVLLQLASCR